MQFVIVTGISGSGKSTAVNVLEDIGYYCIDNMPPELMSKFADICAQSDGKIDKVAFVADVRGGNLFLKLKDAIHDMRNMGIKSAHNTHDTPEAVDPRRTQQKLLVMADRWADGDAEAIADTGDYRRVVQSVLDLARAADEGPREIRVVMEGGAEDFSV